MSEFPTEGEKAVDDCDWSLDPLVALEQMRRARDLLDWKIESAVKDARTGQRYGGTSYETTVDGTKREVQTMKNTSWAEIAEALDITRQSAWRKFAHTVD